MGDLADDGSDEEVPPEQESGESDAEKEIDEEDGDDDEGAGGSYHGDDDDDEDSDAGGKASASTSRGRGYRPKGRGLPKRGAAASKVSRNARQCKTMANKLNVLWKCLMCSVTNKEPIRQSSVCSNYLRIKWKQPVFLLNQGQPDSDNRNKPQAQ